ncbi:MAG TPA: Rieske 2Fe-2S domain-containing protein [Candidatus Dormibacteraeota bacterium]|nr:Rieske 2Fe-2S domain-containing protein [Candidatus Dormibacteraeota bacterium]
MTAAVLDRIIDKLSFLGPWGEVLHNWLAKLGTISGPRAGPAKDFLNGTWLGHPIHPPLTDVPIGAWMGASVLDLADGGQGGGLGKGADVLVALGCAGAVAAAMTGLADWQDQYGRGRDLGTAHALINTGALALCSASLVLRLKGARGPAIGLSLLGLGAAATGGFVGGDMVFRMGVQVNRNAFSSGPKKWTAVAAEDEVVEGTFIRKQVGNSQVLLTRLNGEICAASAICSHAGGSLDELPLEGGQLHCPWHGSQFELRTGQVVHGPATVAIPVFDTRTNEGQVEIRVPQP